MTVWARRLLLLFRLNARSGESVEDAVDEPPGLIIPKPFGEVDSLGEGHSGGDVGLVGELIKAEAEDALFDGMDAHAKVKRA